MMVAVTLKLYIGRAAAEDVATDSQDYSTVVSKLEYHACNVDSQTRCTSCIHTIKSEQEDSDEI